MTLSDTLVLFEERISEREREPAIYCGTSIIFATHWNACSFRYVLL